jgi:Zn-finger in ubiquitin-hydrolases and other protein
MIATCHHTVRVIDVDPPMDVCPSCIAEGGWWKHLRQCLVCGRTGCCDESPNRHASGHYRSEGHEIIRSAEPGEDWIWCFADEVNLRKTDDGIWEEVDLFFEAGMWFAGQKVESTGTFNPGEDEVTDEGFPLGEWATAYRQVHGEGTLDEEKTAALEAIPGWHW